MEDRAKYALIGLFTFAVIAAAFGFIYWLHGASASKETRAYLVVFEGSVSGLRVGGPVLFNGIRVGEVTEMRLTDKPSEVAAVIAITPSTPIRSDTLVTLEYAGLTGIASVSLKGGIPTAAALPAPRSGDLPVLRAASTAGDMGTAVRETLSKADAVIVENQEALRNTIKNLETFSASLARNGDKLDKLIDNSSQAMGSFADLAVSLKKDTDTLTGEIGNVTKDASTLAQNLDKRTAEISESINKLTDTATRHVNVVGADLHRAIINIDKSVTDLAKNPQRIIFGGGNNDNK